MRACGARAGATGRGHRDQKRRGGAGGHGSPVTHVLDGRGEGTKAVGRVRRARRSAVGLTQSAAHGGGAVGRRGMMAVDGGGAGTVVVDDGALALHHGEGESEVRWGHD
jgi:hypothetical protein